MNDILPSRGVDRPGPSPVARPGAASVVVNPPPAAAALTGTTVLEGEVDSLRSNGQAVLRTSLGQLVVAAPPGLEPGSQVTLQLRHAAGQLLATILRIDGHAAHTGQQLPNPAQNPGAAPPPPSAASPRSAPVADVVSLGQGLRAVVLSPAAAAPGGPLGGLAPPPAGTPLSLQVVSISRPGAPAPPGTATAAGTAASPAAPGAPATSGATTPAGPATPGGRVFPATVTGSRGGQAGLLSSPLGTLRLDPPTALPPGTRLQLALDPGFGRQTPAPATAAPTIPMLAQAWPALDEAWTVLHAEEQPFARGAAAELRLPQTGPRLASTLLFFLQALGGGDVGAWLGGQFTAALDRAGRGDLRLRLGQDFAQLAQLADAGGDDWHFVPLPLHDGGSLYQIHLFLRGRQGGKGQGRNGEDEDVTRFVLDVTLSRLGEMQLDGLVRDKRFDLILRSRDPLPETMRRDIAGIFEEANAIGGGAGQIVFQASADWSPMPLAPTAGTDQGLLA